MMTVHIYRDDDEHIGAWYPEDDQVQVPRKGDIVWIESDDVPFDRWRVTKVEWAFINKREGAMKQRRITVEVHVKPKPTGPLWLRVFKLLPRMV